LGKPNDTAYGVVALVLGWILLPFGTLIWAANPLFLLGLRALLKGQGPRALGLGGAAAACALGALAVGEWRVEVGYFVWLAAMLLLAGGALAFRVRSR
jgi:hypothetical protein